MSQLDIGRVGVCLGSESLQRDLASLKAEDAALVSASKTGHDGLAVIAICKDPGGTLIKLLQIHLDRWQALLSAT